MCSILGIISTKAIHSDIIKTMNDKMIHRGPDGEGYFFAGPPNQDQLLTKTVITPKGAAYLALAHRRLSIVDLSDLGHQPMSYLDRYWIVYNGEVYNHIELRAELETLGYTFQSYTDTEIILAAYDAWGTDCLSKFNGMWAFAIYDTHRDTIFLSRDRFGVKPLYYYQDQDHFIFASEIKALLEHPAVTRTPNLAYCKMYLKEGPKEWLRETAFTDIYRFEQSSFIEKPIPDLFTPFQETQFWDFEPNLSNEPFDESKARKYADQYYALLKDAVRIRLRADVKTGAALSGGLDSSSIVYLIDEILKEAGKESLQETFSTVHRQPETMHCDESEHILMVCKHLNVASNTIDPHHLNIQDLHKKGIFFWETPSENIPISGMALCTLVQSKNVTVTLDGQGADEQQAGYLTYIVNYLTQLSLLDLIKNYPKIKKIPGSKRYILAGTLLHIAKKILPIPVLISVARFFNKNLQTHLKPLNQRLKDDTVQGLANLIHYSDSRSMCFSLESRMPFMDYRLVEFTASIPATYKIHNGWTKYFARKAFQNRLPDSIVWRKDKMGWSLPNDHWFQGPLRSWLVKTLSYSAFIQKIAPSLDISILLKRKSIFQTIRYLNLAVWHDTFFSSPSQ